ncbi:hypothetical protein P8452_39376 [Trifolium repens]|nr:hypothetical protein P8452_39376 [Trifolium repens]
MDTPRFSLSLSLSLSTPATCPFTFILSPSSFSPFHICVAFFFFFQLSSHFLLRFFNNPSFLSTIFFCMSLKICLGVEFDMIIGIKE